MNAGTRIVWSLAAIFLAQAALAGHGFGRCAKHMPKKAKAPCHLCETECEPEPACSNEPICYRWRLIEVQEEVFVVEPDVKKKKVEAPVIKPNVVERSCVVRLPVPEDHLMPVSDPHFDRQEFDRFGTVEECFVDECGCTQTVCRDVPEKDVCVHPTTVENEVPVLFWNGPRVEDKYDEVFPERKFEEVEVELRRPKLTKKMITVKRWVRVPMPCEEGCEEECECEHLDALKRKLERKFKDACRDFKYKFNCDAPSFGGGCPTCGG